MANKSISAQDAENNEIQTMDAEVSPKSVAPILEGAAMDNPLQNCPYDSMTAKAIHGKNIVAMVAVEDAKSEKDIVAVAGQQGLSYHMEAETSEAQTKDENGGWGVVFPGIKSWTADIDGLYVFDDAGRKKLVNAMMNDKYVCLMICKRETTDGGVKYTPIRKGLALMTSDDIEAPNDDNMTYSSSFTGSGAPWCYETAAPEEIEALSWTATV